MTRYIILSAIAFAVVFATAFWMLSAADQRAAKEELEGGEVSHLLRREAELISYFCLSRTPPVISKATIPGEWEKALGTKIRLREGTGEITSEAPELAQRATDIQNLGIGESVTVSSGSGSNQQFWLVYRPEQASNQLLALSKTESAARKQLQVVKDTNELLKALIAGLIAAVAVGVSARFVFPPIPKPTAN